MTRWLTCGDENRLLWRYGYLSACHFYGGSTDKDICTDSTCGQRALYALGMTQIPIVCGALIVDNAKTVLMDTILRSTSKSDPTVPTADCYRWLTFVYPTQQLLYRLQVRQAN